MSGNHFRTLAFSLIAFLSINTALAQEKDCSACAVFPSVTVYHTLQQGPGNGVGFEAGTWKRDKGAVSFFFGSSLVWQPASTADQKSGSDASYKPVHMSMYVKSQLSLGGKLYAVVQPGFQDLSFFTLRAGLRYVIPVNNRIGIGLDPNYSVFQHLAAFNTNLHIALR